MAGFIPKRVAAFTEIRKSITIFRNANSKLGNDIKEIEANQFAAELLMPEVFMKKDLKEFPNGLDDKTVENLAKKYSVSILAMQNRLKNLKAI